MQTKHMINSDAYWDNRFDDDWESLQGPAQSRFFARIVIENLPRWLIEQLQRQSLTLCDWGCAQGDGTDVWASYIDSERLTGVDFSSVAIEQAAQRYPSIKFLNENWLDNQANKKSEFDVVFSSNTLEHFHKPYDVLEVLCTRAAKAIVIAIPYRELDRHHEHFYTFLPENIPSRIGNGFRMVWSRVIDCRHLPNAYWNGEQIILVFGKSDWLDDLGLTLHDLFIEQTDHASEIASLNQAVADRDGQIVSLNQQLVDRDGQIANLNQLLADRDGQIVGFKQQLADRDGQIANLNQLLVDRDGQIVNLNQLLADRDGQIVSLNQLLVDRDGQIANLNQLQADRDGQIVNLNQLLVDRDGQIVNLNQLLVDRDGQIVNLNQLLIDRDGQIVSLNQQLVDRDGQIARQHADSLAMSNWASAIDKHPLRHAFKKTAWRIARGTLRSLPVSTATKQRLRDAFFSTIRPLRQSISGKSVEERLLEKDMQSNLHLPPVGAERDVFVFAVIDWHFRIQRPQHIARSLAENGRRVFYFSNDFIDVDEPGYQIERLPGVDALYQIKLHVKGAPRIYFDAPSEQALAMLTSSIAKVIWDFGALSSISVIQHAYWYPLVNRLPNSYRIYDCMDHHEGFGNVPAQLIEIEKEMLSNADLVTVTSSWLESFTKKYNKNVSIVRNAGEYGHFVTYPEQVYKDDKRRRIIGYYGAIAEWFDLDLVRMVALKHPDCLILLVGNDTIGAQKALADLSNVEFTGEVSYAKLPFYLHSFDVCLLPFQVIPLTLATNPVKVYEYLAAGKPVVCVDLPEISQFGDLVLKADSKDHFVKLVGDALEESESRAEQRAIKRRQFASEQTWNHRGAEFVSALKAVRMPRVSVIILTFNNIELTRACLDSVLSRSDYPNLEVIVVDNASSDDTPAYLEALVQSNPDVRVVLNRENLGFAAGNNVGLSIATGDYLIILNNDTVVTQGWVMTLLRHLQNDPGIGIVGPVTNNIGNEARIEAQYKNIEEMPGEAFRYTLLNMGKRHPLRTAAFFCVMFPRSVYELCGPICEDYGRGFFEDDDYCRRVESIGKRVVCAEDVFVHHHLSASFDKLKNSEKQKLFQKNKEIYEKKWGAWTPHSYRN